MRGPQALILPKLPPATVPNSPALLCDASGLQPTAASNYAYAPAGLSLVVTAAAPHLSPQRTQAAQQAPSTDACLRMAHPRRAKANYVVNSACDTASTDEGYMRQHSLPSVKPFLAPQPSNRNASLRDQSMLKEPNSTHTAVQTDGALHAVPAHVLCKCACAMTAGNAAATVTCGRQAHAGSLRLRCPPPTRSSLQMSAWHGTGTHEHVAWTSLSLHAFTECAVWCMGRRVCVHEATH